MGKQIKDILESLLLPANSSWEISEVEVNDITEEISVTVRYTDTVIRIDGTEYPIYDFRHDRSWRHLDLWQYKTFIHARFPRYKTAEGIRSVSVPWADPISRLTSLMEKNDRHAIDHSESNRNHHAAETFFRPGTSCY